jgi:hypothetical protein
MSEGFVSCFGLLEDIQPLRIGAKYESSVLQRQAIKGVHWTLLYFCSSAPCMVFIILLHHMLLILCAARPHVQIPHSHFIMGGTSITSNQKATLTLIDSLHQEFATG